VILLAADSGLVTGISFRNPEQPSLLGTANGAGGAVFNRISPGGIVSVYGIDIGPSQPAGLRLDGNGRVAGDLDGVRLYFNGVAAPLTYAQRDQINAVVPFEIAGAREVTLALVQGGSIVATQALSPVLTDLKLFGDGPDRRIVVNQDGTINSLQNPSRPGSIVSVYGTGAGALTPLAADGEVMPAGIPPHRLNIPVTAVFESQTAAEVHYAGPAPGFVAGVVQINIIAPSASGPHTPAVVLTSGNSQDRFYFWVVP
jgi:uncharacterized protein (TIGR03437 family)